MLATCCLWVRKQQRQSSPEGPGWPHRKWGCWCVGKGRSSSLSFWNGLRQRPAGSSSGLSMDLLCVPRWQVSGALQFWLSRVCIQPPHTAVTVGADLFQELAWQVRCATHREADASRECSLGLWETSCGAGASQGLDTYSRGATPRTGFWTPKAVMKMLTTTMMNTSPVATLFRKSSLACLAGLLRSYLTRKMSSTPTPI